MIRTRWYRLALALAAAFACLALTALDVHSRPASTKFSNAPGTLRITAIASQLGLKVVADSGDEFEIGTTFSGLLEQPEKIAPFGIKAMHNGARVTVSRLAPDKIRVEADEMAPVAADVVVTLRVNDQGLLALVPKA